MAATFRPGDTVAWTHYSDGDPVQRTGTVWAEAPKGEGLSNAWWVHPAEYLPGEVTAAGVIAVGRASRRSWSDSDPQKGEVYGSARWDHQAGALTHGAAGWHARPPERSTR
jgi:hypothetical protein